MPLEVEVAAQSLCFLLFVLHPGSSLRMAGSKTLIRDRCRSRKAAEPSGKMHTGNTK